jgi:4-hydroxy-tetrahydrodipicolinate reductase
MPETKVLVIGAAGRMGRQVVRSLSEARDLTLVAAVDRTRAGEDAGALAGIGSNGITISDSLSDAIAAASPHVAVDFTLPDAVMGNLRTAVRARIPCVVGTTGLTEQNLAEVTDLCDRHKTPVFISPNFAIGAVLMMQFAAQAARHFHAAEIVEFHHADKADAPSGTAIRTAQLIAAVPGSNFAGADSSDGRASRGRAEGAVHIHSVRLPGLVAHQAVIFGGQGETLTIRHDSTSHESFMPGVLLAIRKVRSLRGLVVGLENIL